MEFGKSSDPGSIDFRLPEDHPFTGKTVNGKKKKFSLFAGCAKWGRKEWIGKLYPEGTAEKDFLSHYVRHFNSIELNATFHRPHPPSVIRKWAGTAPEGFRFCPKFPKTITHTKKLLSAEEETNRFFDSVRAFGSKLGPAFLQLPPGFGPAKLLVLDKFLSSLPTDIRVCVEMRDPAWFEGDALEEALELFAEKGAGTVITDTSGRRDVLHMALTLPVAFIRFVGNDLHPTDFTRINSWVEKISVWAENGLEEAYFFMHQHQELDSPRLAAYFIRQANRKMNLGIKEPEFANPAYGQFSS